MVRKIARLLLALSARACSSSEQQAPSEMSLSEINWEGPWAVAQGEYEGSPLFLKIHQGIGPLVGDRRYSNQVGVAVPLRHPDSSGLPTNEEAAQLADIEDALSAALEADHASVQVLSITANGMREFVFYTTSADEARRAFECVQSTVESHELQLMIQADPEWSVYRQFAE